MSTLSACLTVEGSMVPPCPPPGASSWITCHAVAEVKSLTYIDTLHLQAPSEQTTSVEGWSIHRDTCTCSWVGLDGDAVARSVGVRVAITSGRRLDLDPDHVDARRVDHGLAGIRYRPRPHFGHGRGDRLAGFIGQRRADDAAGTVVVLRHNETASCFTNDLVVPRAACPVVGRMERHVVSRLVANHQAGVIDVRRARG